MSVRHHFKDDQYNCSEASQTPITIHILKIIRFIEPRSGVQYNHYLPEYLAKPYKSPPYMCTYTHPPQIMGQDYLMNKSRG